ncbi:hypothetical protein FHW64_005604 [Variovorax sp. Sphag1AA]|nr:hypothetical protein [Variovorax sp. Sphag1AA]
MNFVFVMVRRIDRTWPDRQGLRQTAGAPDVPLYAASRLGDEANLLVSCHRWRRILPIEMRKSAHVRALGADWPRSRTLRTAPDNPLSGALAEVSPNALITRWLPAREDTLCLPYALELRSFGSPSERIVWQQHSVEMRPIEKRVRWQTAALADPSLVAEKNALLAGAWPHARQPPSRRSPPPSGAWGRRVIPGASTPGSCPPMSGAMACDYRGNDR